MQGVFPEGVVKVTEPIAMLEEQPVLYGVSQLGRLVFVENKFVCCII